MSSEISRTYLSPRLTYHFFAMLMMDEENEDINFFACWSVGMNFQDTRSLLERIITLSVFVLKEKLKI